MDIFEKEKWDGKEMKRCFVILSLVVSVFWMASCTKVVVYGSDTLTEAVAGRFTASKNELFYQCVRALDQMGYNLNEISDERGQIITGWRPTTGDSHYMMLFGHKDFSGNAGAYYQLIVTVEEDGPYATVTVSTKVKSVSGKLTSQHVVEKRVLSKLGDFMRSPQIEVTNVGQKDK